MRTFFELCRFGRELREKLPEEIEDALEEGVNSELGRRIKSDVRDYFGKIFRFTIWTLLVALLPLVLIVGLSGEGPLPDWVYWVYSSILLGAIGILAMVVWPLLEITGALRNFPMEVYWPLVRPLLLHVDAINISICGGLLVYFIVRLKNVAMVPALVVFSALWIFAPWIAYYARRGRMFILIRLGQFCALLLVAGIMSLSPVGFRQLVWKAKRDAVGSLRTIEQQEVTSNWQTIHWFTPEGQPNVWYSGDLERGYHLFATPGYNTLTNEVLKPVTSERLKNEITDSFTRQKEAEELGLRLRKEAQKAAEDREAQLKMETQKAEAEARGRLAAQERRERMIREFVVPQWIGSGANDDLPRLIVLNETNEQNASLSARVSQVFALAGLQNVHTAFTPAFVRSQTYRDLLNRKSDPAFPIEEHARYILVVSMSTALSKKTPINDVEMLGAKTIWKIQLIESAGAVTVCQLDVEGTGSAFGETKAQEAGLASKKWTPFRRL